MRGVKKYTAGGVNQQAGSKTNRRGTVFISTYSDLIQITFILVNHHIYYLKTLTTFSFHFRLKTTNSWL